MLTDKEIEQTLRIYYDAFTSKDWITFESMLDDGFTYYTDQCFSQQKPAFVQFLKSNGWQGTGYTLSELSIITSNDLSVAKYRVAFEGSEDGKQLTVIALETTVLQNSKTGLKLLHTHSSNIIEEKT